MEHQRPPSHLRRALTLFARALVLRCPNCGGGGIFEHWFKIKKRCPTCAFVFSRGDPGYQLGSMAIALIIPLVVWFFSFFGIVILTWPAPPWALLQWGSVVFMVGFPLLLQPVSHTLAIALDLLVRPPDQH
jgi:uncharacterized protein (DUF983 family)